MVALISKFAWFRRRICPSSFHLSSSITVLINPVRESDASSLPARPKCAFRRHVSPKALVYGLGFTTSFVLSTTLFVTCLPRRPTVVPTRPPRRPTFLLLSTTFAPTAWLFWAAVLLLSTTCSLL